MSWLALCQNLGTKWLQEPETSALETETLGRSQWGSLSAHQSLSLLGKVVIQRPYVVPPITIFPETNAMDRKNASLCYTHANVVSVEDTEKAPHITSRLNLTTNWTSYNNYC